MNLQSLSSLWTILQVNETHNVASSRLSRPPTSQSTETAAAAALATTQMGD